MYLLDTNVISEIRKGAQANQGVQAFFEETRSQALAVFLSVVTVGELHRGAALIRYRGDYAQAERLDDWLRAVETDYANFILPVDADISALWGRLRVPHHENALDKMIAATAMIHDLKVVTRNTKHFALPGLNVVNPFAN